MITGLVVALPQELDTLTTRKVVKGQSVSLSKNLLLAYSGAGAENARTAANLLIQQGATRLISWGCAAALSPNLQSGDLVLADGLISSDNETISLDSVWYKQVKTTLEKISLESKPGFVLRSGDLLESQVLVAKSTEKQQLYQQNRTVALDMESVAVAKVTQTHNIPCLVIRAIADPVSMDLPEAVSYSLNAKGDVEISKLLLFIFRNPKQIPQLMQLGHCFNAAKTTLKVIAKQLDSIAS